MFSMNLHVKDSDVIEDGETVSGHSEGSDDRKVKHRSIHDQTAWCEVGTSVGSLKRIEQ